MPAELTQTPHRIIWGDRLIQVGAIAAGLLALFPVQSSARYEEWRDAQPAKSRAIGVAFARCAVSGNRSAIVAYLAEPVGTDDSSAMTKALPSQCLDRAIGGLLLAQTALHASPLVMRGLLFEALYAQDFGKRADGLDFEHVAPQTYAVVGVDPAGRSERHDYRALMKLGDCVARAAPDKVRALLASGAASTAESDAITDLSGAWANCLPGHRDLPFSVEMRRATVVEPFYRLLQLSTGRGDAALFAGQNRSGTTAR